MQNHKPLPFGDDCPKCGARLRGDTIYCTRVQSCKSWTVFGGEHLHIQCSCCKYIRTTVCADAERPLLPLEEINRQLDEYTQTELLIDDLEPDFE